MSDCAMHHICVCKAERLAELEKEVKKLRRNNESMNRQMGDLEHMKALFAAVNKAQELLSPFMEENA